MAHKQMIIRPKYHNSHLDGLQVYTHSMTLSRLHVCTKGNSVPRYADYNIIDKLPANRNSGANTTRVLHVKILSFTQIPLASGR